MTRTTYTRDFIISYNYLLLYTITTIIRLITLIMYLFSPI